MADDKIKTTQDLKGATDSATKSSQAHTDAVQANIDALNAWDTETEESIRHQKSLIATLKEEALEIKNTTKEIGSFRSQLLDVTRAGQNFARQLKQQISVSNQYNVLLKEMREGQEDYSKSLVASTDKVGKASAESQKHIDALHDAYFDAKMRAAEYGLETEALTQHTRELAGTFASQLGAMGSQSAALKGLQKDTFLFSRFMGTSYQETLQLVDTRLQSSTKNLDAVRQELMFVAREADNWTKKLQSMGKEALKTGNVTRQGFLRVIKEIQGEFRGGMYAAEGFAKTTGALLEVAKKAGFTPVEAEAMAGGFGKFIKQLGSAQSYWGLRVAQQIGAMLKDISQIQDEALRQRLEPYAKKVLATGELSVVDLQAIAGASQGSSEGIQMLLKAFNASGMHPDLMRTILGQAMGPGQQHIADKLAEFIATGQAEKAFAMVEKGDEASQKQRKKQMDFWKKDLDQLMKEGATTTKIQYQIAKEIHAFRVKTAAFIDKYFIILGPMLMAAQALGPGAGRLLGRGVSALAGKLGFGAAAAAAPTALAPGAAAAAVPGAVAPAAGAVATTGVAAALAGVAAAAVAGVVVGRVIDHVTGEVMAKVSPDLARKLGQDKTLSNWISLAAWPKELSEQVTRFRGVATEGQRKAYTQNKKQIAYARANWAKLDENGREQILKLEDQNKLLGKHVANYTLTETQKKVYDKGREETRKKAIARAWEIEQGFLTDKAFKSDESMQKEIDRLLEMVGPSMTGVQDPAIIMKELKKIGALQAFAAQDFTEEKIRKMVARSLLGAEAGGDIEAWAGKKGGRRVSPAMAGTAREYLEKARAAREQQTGKMMVEVVGGAAGQEQAPKFGADGSVTVYGTSRSETKLTPQVAARLQQTTASRMPKQR